MGLDVRLHPLFAPEAIAWSPPPAQHFDALLLTSANGARCAGPALARYRGLPAYAVGAASAQALASEGFGDVIAGKGDGSAIAARMAQDGRRHALHLAGATVAPIDSGALTITRIPVYRMVALPADPALPAAATPGSVMLVHSARAGEQLAAQLPSPRRATLHLIAISPAALSACGAGWASASAPAHPQDDEMLALARALCEGQAQ